MADTSSQIQILQDKLRKAEDRAERERQRAEEKEKQTRRTTFKELLESCHLLSESTSVQTDKSLSTQGSTTSPKGKSCPTMLRPWMEFPSVQQKAFDEVYSIAVKRGRHPWERSTTTSHVTIWIRTAGKRGSISPFRSSRGQSPSAHWKHFLFCTIRTLRRSQLTSFSVVGHSSQCTDLTIVSIELRCSM